MTGRHFFLPLTAMFMLVSPAFGHAILISSTPAENAVVAKSEVPVTLKFNSRIDAKRSKVTLVSPDGSDKALTVEQPSPDTLTATVKGLVPGAYVLRWQVLATDGHISRGEVPFRTQ